MVTQEHLKFILDYNPDTGIFTWINPNKYSKQKFGDIAGSVDGKGYIHIRIDGSRYKAHRLAWIYMYGIEPKDQIDHINNIKTDNKIKNLRECNNQQNCFNKKLQKNNKSGVKGVSWNKTLNKWTAYLNVNKKKKFIGLFDDIELAELVMYEARIKYHGEYAKAV